MNCELSIFVSNANAYYCNENIVQPLIPSSYHTITINVIKRYYSLSLKSTLFGKDVIFYWDFYLCEIRYT